MPNQGPPGSGAHHGPHNPSGAPGPADPQRIQRVSKFFFKKPRLFLKATYYLHIFSSNFSDA